MFKLAHKFNIFYPSARNYSSHLKLLTHQLTSRGVLRLSGNDTSDLLQGVITNDMGCMLKESCHNSLYSLMLNVQGRIIYDLIIYNIDKIEPSTYLVECDSNMVTELAKTLKKYKIRKKVDITDVSDNYKPWVIFPSAQRADVEIGKDTMYELQYNQSENSSIIANAADPRLKSLGQRMILTDNANVTNLVKNVQETKNSDDYTMLRYKLGVGEGVQDFPPGECFPLESNAVFLNGVCFAKGCYIGQELTARTHHTGVTRKRLMPLVLKNDQNMNLEGGLNIKTEMGKNAGKYRNSVKNYGLGLLRLREAKEKLYIESDSKIEVHSIRPFWWPDDVQM